MTFGERIFKLRTAKGMTQDELALAVGYKSRSTIAKIESGERDPHQSMIAALAKALSTTPAFLMGWEDNSSDFPDWVSDEMFDDNTIFNIAEDVRIHPERYTAETDPSTGKVVAYRINKKIEMLESLFSQLNDEGQGTALERVEELTEIPKYQKYKPIFTFRRLSENKASAGCGYDLNNPDVWKEVDVVDTHEARQADFTVEVEGASMEPDYHDGDIVYISLASEVPVGQVGLFIRDGKGYIKEAGNGCLISRNPDYEDIYPSDENIECKGRVIGIAELAE
ncbi:XRE family transcriptional regulator [Ruminococcus sp.]|uniref:XRE family transcriptional regulator n=1 Tax=Ruminococcus sp. TaxID=41978 RepID=UPI0038657D1B